MGLIETHRAGYLAPELNHVVAALTTGQRTPRVPDGHLVRTARAVVRLPSTPDVPGAPWADVLRCEAATDLALPQLTALPNLSQAVLCRYASVAYKDSRAPQNLAPSLGCGTPFGTGSAPRASVPGAARCSHVTSIIRTEILRSAFLGIHS